MIVRVRYLSTMRSFTNRSEEEFALKEESVLSELLNKLASIYGKAFQKEIFEPNSKSLKSGFVAMINGVLIGQLKGVDTQLRNGDNIIFMPLMTGG